MSNIDTTSHFSKKVFRQTRSIQQVQGLLGAFQIV